MGIFSFGKKDDAPSRRGANTSSNRAPRSERVERRTRRTERTVDADAMLLDPTLPEKQRARRRLVGAIAMVVAAVVILPMVLDSHPKPVTDDISIDIPSRPAPKLAKRDEDTQAGVAPDNPTPDAALAASGLAPAAPAAQTQSGAAKQAEANAKPTPAAKPAAKPQAPAVAANTAPTAAPATPAVAENSATKPANKPAAKPPARANATAAAPSVDETNTTAASADANSGTPASPPGSRFAVQLGAFANEANARNWAVKLKAAGVPAYTEHRKQTDGTTLTLLRAGPFADRAAASAAIAKVREVGLTSAANSGAAQ
ncbi:SPOR domain-containing protein [Paraburkholderia rhynchosiae]|uniref:Cell division protein DedD n=1 Tax=Paraburkholderia rhynchosiae TaxID=487049 RepID=A0A2N7WAM1_9BURK|nr:SPOR domain-containing protein [Paraburkholderia rhynchosiae]PMS26448.1 SPOR domain-containing protein [Paraburkholderia rhynchosiae]CAB3716163.1 Cell division protein DedD [Paraburkholderia rhynchosiae]